MKKTYTAPSVDVMLGELESAIAAASTFTMGYDPNQTTQTMEAKRSQWTSFDFDDEDDE